MVLEYLKFFASLWSVWIVVALITLFIKAVCEEKITLLKALNTEPSMKLRLTERFFHTATIGFLILLVASLGALLLLRLLPSIHST